MGEEKRKADEATESPRKMPRLDAAAAETLLELSHPPSTEEGEEATIGVSTYDIGSCEHLFLDSEELDEIARGIKAACKPPTCEHDTCGTTSAAGMMVCTECSYTSCIGEKGDREDPRGHARWHASTDQHWVALWCDDPSKGYCFECGLTLMLGHSKVNEDDYALVPRNGKDEWRTGASKAMDPWLVAFRNATDLRGMVGSDAMDRLGMAGCNAMDLWGAVGSNAMDHSRMVAGDDHVIRGMPNYGNTCYMNASLQCLLALGKLRTMILSPDARLGNIGLHLKQLFVETSSGNNAGHMLDPKMILEDMWSLHPNRFRPKVMGDSHEFLVSLCNALDNEVEQLNKLHIMQGDALFPTFGYSIFKCELLETISCKSCSHNEVTHHSLDGLQLQVQSNDSPTRSKHLQVEYLNSAVSIEGCLTLFSHGLKNCMNCSKVAADLPETNGSKIVDPIMASTNLNATVDGDQTDLSDTKRSPSEASSDLSSLSVESPSRKPYSSDSYHQNILSGDITSEEVTSGKSCGEKDLVSCSTANEKAESPEGVQEASPSFLTSDEQNDLLRAQDIQDTSTQKQGSGKQVNYDHSAQQVAEKQSKQTDGNGVATQTQLITKLPPVLTIQLQRYTDNLSKLSGHVSFKEILHVGPFMDPSSEDKDKSSYRLVGVIEHRGLQMNSGHYIAYVRASRKQQGSGPSSWVCANDEIIRRVPLEQVLRCEAYILFYERIDD